MTSYYEVGTYVTVFCLTPASFLHSAKSLLFADDCLSEISPSFILTI